MVKLCLKIIKNQCTLKTELKKKIIKKEKLTNEFIYTCYNIRLLIYKKKINTQRERLTKQKKLHSTNNENRIECCK